MFSSWRKSMNFAAVLVADRAIERERRLGPAPFIFSSFSCGMPVSFSSSSSVGSRPVRAMSLRRALHAVVRVEHVHGDADRAALVGERAADRVADPPRRVGREAVAARCSRSARRPS
jgi:hypothetical protein